MVNVYDEVQHVYTQGVRAELDGLAFEEARWEYIIMKTEKTLAERCRVEAAETASDLAVRTASEEVAQKALALGGEVPYEHILSPVLTKQGTAEFTTLHRRDG